MNATLTLPDGRRLDLGTRPLLMGVVNVTPDSFSDGGLFADPAVAVAHGLMLARQGADIVDVGGESTRPDHVRLDAASELARVVPVIAGIATQSDIPISIDTYKAEVAEAALKAGAAIVNDVWGAQREPAIAGVAARHGAPIVLMHNREEVDPNIDILTDVMRFLERSIAIALKAGVQRSQIVVDPGIGRFGKTAEQSLLLMKQLRRLGELGCPVLLGASRKSVLGHVIGKAVPAERVAASIAAHLYGVTQGAAIIRAHDVDEHVDALKIWAAIGSSTMSATGQIFIEALDLYAYHGHFAEEGRLGQRFSMDLVLDCDLRASSLSDDIADTVDYGEVVGLVTRTFSGKRFKLLEAAARALAEAILAGYPTVTRVVVTLRKPAPPIPGRMDSVGIKLDFTR